MWMQIYHYALEGTPFWHAYVVADHHYHFKCFGIPEGGELSEERNIGNSLNQAKCIAVPDVDSPLAIRGTAGIVYLKTGVSYQAVNRILHMHADCRNTPGFWTTVPLYGFHGNDYALWLPGYSWCKFTNITSDVDQKPPDPLLQDLHTFYEDVRDRSLQNNFETKRRELEIIFGHTSKEVSTLHLDAMTNLALETLYQLDRVPGILSSKKELLSSAYLNANSLFRTYHKALNGILGSDLCKEVFKYEHHESRDWFLPLAPME